MHSFLTPIVVVGQREPSLPDKKEPERFHELPPLITTTFFGRQEELKLMRKHLTAARRSVICGIGGAGKSRLAYAYYTAYASEFSSAFWVDGKDVTSMRTDFVAISRHLKLPEAPPLKSANSEMPCSQIAAVEAVVRWFKNKDNDDWLLIIDNLEINAKDLLDFLPRGKQGHVIFTTQNRQAASLGPTIELGEMSQQDALELFLHHADMGNFTSKELDICKEIISRLGRLALAVEHAAAFVRRNGKMPLRYLQRLEQELGATLENSPEYTNHRLSVMATYKVTFKAIFENYRPAAYLLTYIGAFDGESLPENILQAPCIGPSIKSSCTHESKDYNFIDDYAKAMDVLLSYSLVRLRYLEDGTTAISMHGLVHKCVQAKRTQESQWFYLGKAAIIIYLVTTEEPCNPLIFAQIRYLLKTVTDRAAQSSTGKVPDDLWLLLGHLMFTHMLYWQAAGIMQELNRFSKVTMEALGKSGRDEDRVMLAAVSITYAATVAFCNNEETMESASRDFLYTQMLPHVADVLQDLDQRMAKSHDIISLDLHPAQLADIYTHTHPPDYVRNLRAITERVSWVYFGFNQPEVGSFYCQLSQLPVRNTITSTVRGFFSALSGILPAYATGSTTKDNICQLHKVAAYDRHAGSINSTLELFRYLTSDEKTKPEDPLFNATLCDYIKLLCKLGRTEEAAKAAEKFEYPSSKITETDIAMRQRWHYLWMRKASTVAKVDHENHEEAEKTLLETHAVSKLIFGSKSLNVTHAAFLLQMFYSRSCCNDLTKAEMYAVEARNTFTHLYGDKAKLQKSEGLYMAKTLLSQGALEEAAYCLELLQNWRRVNWGLMILSLLVLCVYWLWPRQKEKKS